MKPLNAVWILQVLLVTVNALYGSHSDVVELTPSNFNSKVVESDDIWIVEFYAPWCGHCQAFVSEYSKAASALKGIVKVGAVDSDQHKTFGSQYGIRGFPTVKIFGSNKKKPQDFSGSRTAQGLVDAAFKELRNAVDSRLSGKKTREGSSGDGDKKESDTEDVIELTDSNFKKTVLDSEDMWLIEFYAPWCGHCKNLAPHWEKAASKLKGKVKLGALDATVHTVMAQKYQIKGFPTIKYFGPGQKDSDSAEDYDGGRTSEDIINWANEKVSENAPPPKVNQIIDEDTLKQACESHQLCIVSFLPHILDCQSACRNEYIDTLLKVGNKYKKNRWGWIWAEATAQPQLEEVLGIGGFGYPAMAAVNVRKMKFSILRGSFSNDGISEFIREVSVGRGSSAPIKGAKLPEIVTTEPWDGKDGELPVEEDIDLSDVDLDDVHTEL